LSILENVMSAAFPGYKKIKEVQEAQKKNHVIAEGIATKSVRDYQLEYNIDIIYTLSIHEKGKKKEFYLTEVTDRQEEEFVRNSYLDGKGHILLINENEKNRIVVDAYFRNKSGLKELYSRGVRAVESDMTIPDFLYMIEEHEYIILLKPKFVAKNEGNRKGELNRLYKYLFGNLGKQIDIDVNFDKAGCYENGCKLIYFRLHSDSLFLVVEYEGELFSHTFKNIYRIAAGYSYGENALKFWLYMGDTSTYRFYLYHPEEIKTPVDPAIYQTSKDIVPVS
jgi:hypothetical protein